MSPTRFRPHLGFQAKVLVPVIGIMVALMWTTTWVVDVQIGRQMEDEARVRLDAADAVFQNSHQIRARNAMLRYPSPANESRYKAVFQTRDPNTIRALLHDIKKEFDADLVAYASDTGEPIAIVTGDPLLESKNLARNAEASIDRALEGHLNADTIDIEGRLLEIVSVPVILGKDLIVTGVLVVGTEIGEPAALEFRDLTGSEIVFMVRDRVAASTLNRFNATDGMVAVWQHAWQHAWPSPGTEKPRSPTTTGPRKIQLGSDHFLWRAGRFNTLGSDREIGYLMFFSYEQSWQALQRLESMLLWLRLFSLALASAFVWLLVRRVTQPLRHLRDAADAVGRGDFSRKVSVQSKDECGELAASFNQMTENLRNSRTQLENTVETLTNTRARLTQSEKLSAIGEVVAGVAHELNNPLTGVLGSAELVRDTTQDPEQRQFLDLIVSEANRCQRIVQGLLSFARQHPPEREWVHLGAVIDASLAILRYQLRTANVKVARQISPDLPPVLGDEHQLQQVFVNLINNARQAIEAHRRDGLLTITAAHHDNHVTLEFRDNGPGIPEANLPRIFDPFFTTKEVGKGTGLGLSLSYGIIKEHGGNITVFSRPGDGAAFTIDLPAVADTLPATPKASPTVSLQPSSTAPGKRLLVVDDEDSILRLARTALSRDGYTVDTAADGESALRKIRAESYDLILCDIRMPGMGGDQVYEQLRTENPKLADSMVFMTGDIMGDQARQFLGDGLRPFLSKPFDLSSLRDFIAHSLRA